MQTPKIINSFFVLITLSFVFNACDVTTAPKANYIPNTEGINAQVEIIRFEKDFFAIDTSNVEQGLVELKQKHPDFTTTIDVVFYPEWNTSMVSEEGKRVLGL